MLSPLEMITRLAMAILLGGVLGFEREYRSKPAGLRTHMMVALGSACFSLTALGRTYRVSPGLPVDSTIVDPTRVVQGIIGGIGFLGAGAILREGSSVRGLTTAGSLWLAGALGIACGSGNYALAGVASALALLVLFVLGWMEHRVRRNGGDETS